MQFSRKNDLFSNEIVMWIIHSHKSHTRDFESVNVCGLLIERKKLCKKSNLKRKNLVKIKWKS